MTNSVGKIILITHAQKFSKVVGRCRVSKPKFLNDVYYSLIYSHLFYCITSRGCASKTRLMPLLKLQK